ncbi:peptidyl-prolyl cis-trans isomerase FKBP8-like [Solea solea]|uniref:peptidyl-prolyl cis-trans isomerase FKBP8-like n=1 Tax=Solea solea TaxID=90069 RepID=UPI00272A9D5B|nr:peptidyl-prolyl cis-trans isomerase FKBP8-like [Solea solea]XP_058494791.1 peptidyl-prolyl cis-trans isomerase FKBP8-like [Solea solea]
MDASHENDSIPSENDGQTSMLGSWVDVEVIEDLDLNSVKSNADSEPDPAGQVDEWLDVFGYGQLKKKVLEAGQGSQPQKGQHVVINLKTSLKNGTLVNQQTNVAFTLGDGDIIQALDLIVPFMEMGEKALIQTDATYAYGIHGSHEPEVPPNAELSLEVELLEVMDALDLELLLPTEKSALVRLKRERGNVHYQRKDYAVAVNSYTIALQITESNSNTDINPDEEKELMDEKVKCLNNMAASQLKMKRYDQALQSSISILAHQPDNVKALYRIGKVLTFQGEYSEAIQTLKRALKLEPENKTINAELSKLVKMHLEQREAEKAVDMKLLDNLTTRNCSTQTDVDMSSTGVSWKWVFAATVVVFGGIAMSVFISTRK